MFHRWDDVTTNPQFVGWTPIHSVGYIDIIAANLSNKEIGVAIYF